MPIGSTKFGTSNNNLRQMPDVKGDLEIKVATILSDCSDAEQPPMRSLDCSQPADDLTRRNVLALAAMGIMPALRSASTTGQKQNPQNPAENMPPGRIFARVQAFGPENKQGIIAITPADGSWQWVEQMPGLVRLSPDGHTLAF